MIKNIISVVLCLWWVTATAQEQNAGRPRFIGLKANCDWAGVGGGITYEKATGSHKTIYHYLGAGVSFPNTRYYGQFFYRFISLNYIYDEDRRKPFIRNYPLCFSYHIGDRKYWKGIDQSSWFRTRRALLGIGKGTDRITQQIYYNAFRCMVGAEYGWGYQFRLNKQLFLSVDGGIGAAVNYQAVSKHTFAYYLSYDKKYSLFFLVPVHCGITLKRTF